MLGENRIYLPRLTKPLQLFLFHIKEGKVQALVMLSLNLKIIIFWSMMLMIRWNATKGSFEMLSNIEDYVEKC